MNGGRGREERGNGKNRKKKGYLLVSCLSLSYGSVIVIPDGNLLGQSLVNGRQSLCEDVQVVLHTLLLFLLEQNLPVELVPF